MTRLGLIAACLFGAVALSRAQEGPCHGLECVILYADSGCSRQVLQFAPTCDNTCKTYVSSHPLHGSVLANMYGRSLSNGQTFRSIQVQGDGRKGTNCEVYQDANCQADLGATGNNIRTSTCEENGQAMKSFRCYFNC